MKNLNTDKVNSLLNQILEFELAGVIRYTHYSLMVTGPYRMTIVEFFKEQAQESLLHAQTVGEILTGLEGHPSLSITPMEETFDHSIKNILQESLTHEEKALDLYNELLKEVEGKSIYLEEFTRSQISEEETHSLELRKMLRDYA